ncbi:hypothetical protein M011DRAFT_474608 [Sporormia fimetaria CBS 119925]|uniref:Uncharacterized protein n=1 Tax=Sporormia fimetaria CBS 119925 TaxID=1340428 RepID=A0A6A6VK83_9PLEO|nr:hypothetical protein M011DRAFT_474608 [Sporormia fimetaria CBS 119925]
MATADPLVTAGAQGVVLLPLLFQGNQHRRQLQAHDEELAALRRDNSQRHTEKPPVESRKPADEIVKKLSEELNVSEKLSDFQALPRNSSVDQVIANLVNETAARTAIESPYSKLNYDILRFFEFTEEVITSLQCQPLNTCHAGILQEWMTTTKSLAEYSNHPVRPAYRFAQKLLERLMNVNASWQSARAEGQEAGSKLQEARERLQEEQKRAEDLRSRNTVLENELTESKEAILTARRDEGLAKADANNFEAK